MKLFLSVLVIGLFATAANADQYVNGHMRSDGTYTSGYYRSSPDNNPYNNYSYKGNINPYNGQQGTVNPNPAPSFNTYQPNTNSGGFGNYQNPYKR